MRSPICIPLVVAGLLLTNQTSPAQPPAAMSQPKPAVQPAPEPLSEEEEKSLAARDEEPAPEVAGGALSNLHLTYIVIALAAAVLVLVLK